jgi:DMSO reductase anchor subunit
MHPAFSVIFFSTLSGLGYGLLFWSSLYLAGSAQTALAGRTPAIFLVALLLAFLLVSIGLLSSLGHLGKPARAWRAFSQWRTSWLSREGVAAVATYVPFVVLIATLSSPWWPAPLDGEAFAPGNALPWFALFSLAGGVAGALATVWCTAMIYASLKPVPAWRQPLVLPVYLVFSLQGGLLLLAFLLVLGGVRIGALIPVLSVLGAAALFAMKVAYWRAIDRGESPSTRASALGLPADRIATVFERPHTEANYLTKEMGFVVARRHAQKLRRIALVLFALLPTLACVFAALQPGWALPLLAVAVLATVLGTVVERWLFFAEAKHLVTLYY